MIKYKNYKIILFVIFHLIDGGLKTFNSKPKIGVIYINFYVRNWSNHNYLNLYFMFLRICNKKTQDLVKIDFVGNKHDPSLGNTTVLHLEQPSSGHKRPREFSLWALLTNVLGIFSQKSIWPNWFISGRKYPG